MKHLVFFSTLLTASLLWFYETSHPHRDPASRIEMNCLQSVLKIVEIPFSKSSGLSDLMDSARSELRFKKVIISSGGRRFDVLELDLSGDDPLVQELKDFQKQFGEQKVYFLTDARQSDWVETAKHWRGLFDDEERIFLSYSTSRYLLIEEVDHYHFIFALETFRHELAHARFAIQARAGEIHPYRTVIKAQEKSLGVLSGSSYDTMLSLEEVSTYQLNIWRLKNAYLNDLLNFSKKNQVQEFDSYFVSYALIMERIQVLMKDLESMDRYFYGVHPNGTYLHLDIHDLEQPNHLLRQWQLPISAYRLELPEQFVSHTKTFLEKLKRTYAEDLAIYQRDTLWSEALQVMSRARWSDQKMREHLKLFDEILRNTLWLFEQGPDFDKIMDVAWSKMVSARSENTHFFSTIEKIERIFAKNIQTQSKHANVFQSVVRDWIVSDEIIFYKDQLILMNGEGWGFGLDDRGGIISLVFQKEKEFLVIPFKE